MKPTLYAVSQVSRNHRGGGGAREGLSVTDRTGLASPV